MRILWIKKQVKISDILETIPGCIYWKDVDGVYLGCNQAEAEVLGFKYPNEVIGKTDYDLLCKNEAEILRKIDQRIMQNEVSEQILEELTTSDGRKVIMLTKKSPLYDDKNNIIGIIGVSIDITDRRAKEGKENELKMRHYINNILEYVPGCIYWKDVDGVYLGCNQAESEVLGFKYPNEVIGKTDYDLSWKYEAEVLRKTDQRIMESRKVEEIRNTGDSNSK
jgi:PAS domain S-box-containing protein